MNTPEAILARIAPPDENGCRVWTGRLGSSGYARVTINSHIYPVHRWAYEYFVGPIPDGLVLDHLCRNRACSEVSHLEPVTQYINLMRGEGIPARNARKEFCLNGHPLVSRTGMRRYCKECNRLRQFRYKGLEPLPRRSCIHAHMRKDGWCPNCRLWTKEINSFAN